jgi:hypothetical protein
MSESLYYNPHNAAIETLPMIYGFVAAKTDLGVRGRIVAEDGTWLGEHCSSNEEFARMDLGMKEGTHWISQHERFRAHYPNGYRTVFVEENGTAPGFGGALERAKGGAPLKIDICPLCHDTCQIKYLNFFGSKIKLVICECVSRQWVLCAPKGALSDE